MEIGVGLDTTLNLSFPEQAQLCQEAARLGYTSIWTHEVTAYDAFLVCAHRWSATCAVIPGGLTTGIGVSPVPVRTPVSLAMSAGTLSEMTGGRFILGIGSSGAYGVGYRRSLGLPRISPLALMRDHLVTIRALLAGETVTYEGQVITLRSIKLAINPPPRTPVYLGALGPEMLRLGGELADGVFLNWCTPEQVIWSRERIAEGAARSGRDASALKVASYIRVCVDDDVDLARRALTRAMLGYALGRHGATARERGLGYRAHFDRMGFAEVLEGLDQMRERGASMDELVEAFPTDLLRQVGYWGPANEAGPAFRRLAEGLDIAIVRVVAARPGIDSVLVAIRACQPQLVGA